eukprot:TRINITY_DN6693_c0_g1_i1.p1 TRINITY_DN6693_c0_g1~~TRINITY_DN6693_c0_g1_i1.p1  ORF type:complete len:378 (+),score=-9.85 TRINITY_DN6693_c0_g1_i1:149-1282(+)
MDVATAYATDLHTAVLSGRVAAIRRYIDRGARVTARDRIDRTPLHWAVALGCEDVAKVLVVNTPPRALQLADKYGRTALHYAAGAGDVTLARVLINRGASTEPADSKGVTPLHLAAEQVEPEFTQLLLGHGVACAPRDAQGRTPRDYAERVGSVVCAKLLKEAEDRSEAREAAKDEVRGVAAASVSILSFCSKQSYFEGKASRVSVRSEIENAFVKEASRKPASLTVEECLADWRRCVREERREPCGPPEKRPVMTLASGSRDIVGATNGLRTKTLTTDKATSVFTGMTDRSSGEGVVTPPDTGVRRKPLGVLQHNHGGTPRANSFSGFQQWLSCQESGSSTSSLESLWDVLKRSDTRESAPGEASWSAGFHRIISV